MAVGETVSALPDGAGRQDLSGRRFGMLTALEYVRTESGRYAWKCLCDCGNITYKTTGHLNSNAVSCGCARKKDLSSQRFGKLLVLEKTDKRRQGSIVWKCLCDCGNLCEKSSSQLNSGAAQSCGCSWRQAAVSEGERFGRLVAVRATEQRSAKSVVWECVCDCGNRVLVRSTMLRSGHTTSCGCVKRELDGQRDFKKLLTYTDDTCIEFLQNIGKSREGTSAETGVRGVFVKDGKYQAQIFFRKKRYDLGRYSELGDAVQARKRAEQRVEEYLEQYRSGVASPDIDFIRGNID